MAKIILNNKEFNIDDAVIASISEGLKNHLLTTMAGSGATITLDGVTYNVDSTKLATAKNAFVSHLGTISGEGSKVTINGVEYSVDSTKLQGAMSELGTAFAGLSGGDTPTPEEERLEGDGAEYYTLAPTALSFRSTAPLNELQEVQINGVTVDPSNYTLEEGSTIVTFPIEYLKTLEKGSYEVDVVSENKSVKGGFTVTAPELNEYGFYYNQPYTATVPSIVPILGGWTVAFFIREDGTFDSIAVGANTETGTYEINGNEIIAVSPLMGQINCTISADGTAIYCSQIDTNFVLGDNSVAADDDYIYIYKEDLGGYEVQCIDKTKALYGDIKTGINGIDTVKLADYAFVANNGVEYTANTTLIAIPNMPDSITTIGDYAFQFCTSLTSITIPDNVTSIGSCAFYWCTNLNSITFNGTTSQWNAITKGAGWTNNVPATYVQCSDGQVAL